MDYNSAAIAIAVMGPTGSGKTSFVNLASHSNLPVGMGLESCTAEVQLANEFTLDGRGVVLIDTPGFDDTTKSDTDILKDIAAFLATTYKNASKLSGVIYIHRISDMRFSGIAGRNFKMFRDLCGESSLRNVVLVTNMWGQVSDDLGKARERELGSRFLKPALDKGAQMVRHHNTEQSAHDVIRRITNNHPVVLQIQRELVDEHKDVGNTAAGEAIDKELQEAARRHEAELKQVQEEMARSLREKEEETRRKLEEEARKREEEMRRRREEAEWVALQHRQEMERAEMEVRRLEEQARTERERAEAEHQRQMALLNEQLERVWNPSGGIPSFVKTMYWNILDRRAESQAVVDGWTNHTYTHGLAHTFGGFFTSLEYSNRGLPTEVTVDKFYLAVLGRQAESEGKAHWAGKIRNGMTFWQVAKGFVGSAEYRAKVQAGTAPHPVHWP